MSRRLQFCNIITGEICVLLWKRGGGGVRGRRERKREKIRRTGGKEIL
jgi:hypothetical protein